MIGRTGATVPAHFSHPALAHRSIQAPTLRPSRGLNLLETSRFTRQNFEHLQTRAAATPSPHLPPCHSCPHPELDVARLKLLQQRVNALNTHGHGRRRGCQLRRLLLHLVDQQALARLRVLLRAKRVGKWQASQLSLQLRVLAYAKAMKGPFDCLCPSHLQLQQLLCIRLRYLGKLVVRVQRLRMQEAGNRSAQGRGDAGTFRL